MVDEDRPLSDVDQKFVENALDVVKLRFLRREEDFSSDKLEEYGVEFAHQHFGESETIFGYQNLSVTINYTASTLYIFPEFKYSRTSNEGGTIRPDDLYGLLQNQLPTGNFFIMVDSKKEFMQKLAEQKNFSPFGTFVSTLTGTSQLSEEPVAKRAKSDTSTFELCKVTESSPKFDIFLAQLQTLALWYIDAAEYTDNSDERWMHYILYEIYYETDESGQLCKRYAVAGYASLFRFYHYPDQYRVRIAHLLLLPKHRNSGMGARFLDAIYKDLRTITKLYDITVEDAADSMIYLRDYVDCIDCSTLPEFSEAKLKEGFSPLMQQAALDKFKIHSKQARRVYEILRYFTINKEDQDELTKYRIDIKRRLEKPLKRRAKDMANLKRAFDENTINQMSNPEVIKAQLAALYEETIKGYEVVAERLKNHPTI